MHIASFGNFHESKSQTLMIEIEQFAHNPWFNDHFAVLFPFLSKIIPDNRIYKKIQIFFVMKNTNKDKKCSLAPSSRFSIWHHLVRFRKGFVSSKRPFWETIWVSSLSSFTPRPRISSTVSSSERALSICSRSSRSSSLSSGSFCVQHLKFIKGS